MDGSIIGLLGFVALFLLIFLKVPIAFAFGLIGFVGFCYLSSFEAAMTTLITTVWSYATSYVLMAVPLFILMGQFASYSRIGDELYAVAAKWLGRLPGGLAIATVWGSAGFAACTGSSGAGILTFAPIAYKPMKNAGYDNRLILGTLCCGATMGTLIPPSITFIIYGSITDESVGKLFMAGIFPGLLEAALYSAIIVILASYRIWAAPPGGAVSLREKLISLKGIWGFLIIMTLVIGGIYSGFFTPTEAAGIGATGALLILVSRKGLRWEPIKASSPYPKKFEVTVEVEGQEVKGVKCFPLQWTAGTPPEGIAGELAYVGDGSQSYFQLVDVKGKIALIDEKMMRGATPSARSNGAVVKAKDRGAIGVIRAGLQVDSPQFQKNDPTRPPDVFPIPVFTVGKSEGDYLRDLAVRGTSHSVRMVLDVPHETFDAFNIVFELRGNGSMEEVILVGTHYDTGMFTGAVDNNGSVALMIAWARYFASKPRNSRNRDMIFAWCFGHDFDNNTGHYQFAEAHKDQLKKAIVWDVDHVVA